MVHLGDADAMLCGLVGKFDSHLAHVRDVLGLKQGAGEFATVNAVMLDSGTLFIADTYINEAPNATELADIARLAAEEVARFGLPPKMRAARDLFAAANPDVECDGEMHGDSALSEAIRDRALLESSLHGEANVLICPNLDAANILFNVLKTTGGHGTTIGPILLGGAAAAHVLTPSATVRRVVNMTALPQPGHRCPRLIRAAPKKARPSQGRPFTPPAPAGAA
ncbi:Pro-neuregulin-3, membrane-bound isoform [Manis javanica]|nr:Pro-neuregulin-3, membrane-bound isoform [Manis javanica]